MSGRSARSLASATCLKAACARAASACGSRRSSNEVATGSHIWAERYDRDLADVFAVQDEITASIVGRSSRGFTPRRISRARASCRKAWTPGNSLCARCRITGARRGRAMLTARRCWRRRSRSIRTRPGHSVSRDQSCFRRASGLADPTTSIPIAEHAALHPIRPTARIPGRITLWAALHVHASLRRLAGAVRSGAEPQSEFLARAWASRPCSGVLRSLGGGLGGNQPRIAAEPARSVAAMYYGAAGLAQYIGADYEEAIRVARVATRRAAISRAANARSSPPPRWPVTPRSRRARFMSYAACSQPYTRLDSEGDTAEAGDRPGALSRGLPPRGPGIVSSSVG